MTKIFPKNPQSTSVDFRSPAREFILWRVRRPTVKLFITEVDTNGHCRAPTPGDVMLCRI
ncbi:MAG: hypothetical protein KME40_21895 [Komarekiella atlantica HA4396-MV6]|nr:hypothetical protein [Komarekiella atlantica HA4396-MV6]